MSPKTLAECRHQHYDVFHLATLAEAQAFATHPEHHSGGVAFSELVNEKFNTVLHVAAFPQQKARKVQTFTAQGENITWKHHAE